MTKYRVVWEIDIEADTPEDAARQAFDHMQLPGTTANCFDVFDEDDQPVFIDLMETEMVTLFPSTTPKKELPQ